LGEGWGEGLGGLTRLPSIVPPRWDDESSGNGSTPYDSFRHFARVYFLGDPAPEDRLAAVFSMSDFTFYGDESYGDGVDAYAVAGYVASVNQWEKFIEAWKEFRRAENFCVLHKAELEHCATGSDFEWKGLSPDEKYERKTRINKRACELIVQHAAFGVGHAVQKSEWQRSIAEHDAKWPGLLGRSFYAAGVYGCLNLAAELMENTRRTGMIRYVFEDKKRDGRGEAEDLLRALKADERTRDRFRIAGYSFESKHDPEFIPLQAADFLAYESFKQINNQILAGGLKLDRNGNLVGPRGVFRNLVQADDPRYVTNPNDLPCPHRGSWMDATTIRSMVADIKLRLGTGDLVDIDHETKDRV
jgi:hypothetical protein